MNLDEELKWVLSVGVVKSSAETADSQECDPGPTNPIP